MQTVQNFQSMAKRLFAVALFLMVSTLTFAQSKITGVVVDENGEPLLGVSVMEVGTKNGTTTNMEGVYTLTVGAKSQLQFTYVGYETKTVAASAATSVELTPDDTQLNEVVVVGYGTMRRKDLTSSITTVKADDLNKGVFTDAASMLQGKVAGITVTSTGDPNGNPSITLRGASSIRDGAMSPYYVVDGIPGVDLSMVAPDDIESIDVLRDATATAIYGSKAANGVIIVTTKKGSKERVNVSYNGYVAIDNVLNTLDIASADDIRDYVKRKQQLDPSYTYMYDYGQNTDWQKEVLRTGISHNHNVSINGGSEKTTYMASINLVNRQGVIEGTDMNRANLRSLVTTKILKDRLEVGAGINGMTGKHVGVPMWDEGRSVLDAMNYFNPTLGIRQADGDWTHGDGSNNYNPLSLLNENSTQSEWKRMQFIAKATAYIVDGLTWNVNYSYDNHQRISSEYDSHNSQIIEKWGATSPAFNGVAHRSTYFGSKQTFETYGNYDKTFGVHKLGLMAGYSWEESNSNDGFGVRVSGFLNDDIKWYNLTYAGNTKIQWVESGNLDNIRNISFYGRLNYSYDSRYMFQASIRRDGSSVFGKDHRWGTFPSASVAWNITEEKFMKDQNVVNNLKLRAGYGISGNAMGFGAYTPVITYGSTGNVVDGYVTLAANKLANPDLKWESTGMFNVGLDFAFFNSRLNGSIEVYNKKTTDLIWDYPVSTYIYPYGSIKANVGEMTNKGIELTLNAVPVQTKNFTWSTTINLAHNKNTINSLSNDVYKTSTFAQGDPMVAGVSANGYTQRIMEGQPLGTFYTYEWAGVDADGISVYYTHDATTGERDGGVTKAPEYKDRTITGCAQPKLNAGWNNTLTYKNWSLNAFITGVFGNDVYNGLRAHYTAPDFFAGGKNVLKEFIYERGLNDTGSNQPSDRFIENGSYIRLQSLTLSYMFKNCFNDWIDNLTLYATGNNLVTITNYKGLDPEVNLGGITPGVDYRWSTYPHTRTIMVGVKVNFGGAKAKKAAAPRIIEREVIKEVPVVKEVVKEVVKTVAAPANTAAVAKTSVVQSTYVVTFASSSTEIANPAELDGIEKGQTVEVVAYASPDGPADRNQELSQKRADAVANYLKSKGVNVVRVEAKGADTAHANRIAIVTVK